MVPELRNKSRQIYLKHREEQVLDLYKRNLDDEVRVFGGEDLSETEKRIFELKQQLFQLAERKREKDSDVTLY